MKKSVSIFIFLFLSAHTSFSQGREDVARELLNKTGSGKMGIQVMNQMMDSYEKAFPKVPHEFWEEFKKEVRAEDLVEMILPVYTSHFTSEEMQELINFYDTAIGKKYIKLMPEIMRESMEVGQAWGKEIGEKVRAKMEKKGYQ
jgi:hypothetical protein